MTDKKIKPEPTPEQAFAKELKDAARRNGLQHLKALKEYHDMGTSIKRKGIEDSKISQMIENAIQDYEWDLREKRIGR